LAKLRFDAGMVCRGATGVRSQDARKPRDADGRRIGDSAEPHIRATESSIGGSHPQIKRSVGRADARRTVSAELRGRLR
jgi:hypothetical protein